MLHRFLSAIIAIAATLSAGAQGTCIINGNIANSKNIKKVSLISIDEFGNKKTVATSKVKKGKYTFKREITANEPTMLYTIAGFGEKEIELFIEPGEINVNTASTAAPEQSVVTGTPTNDEYTEYKAIERTALSNVEKQLDSLQQLKGHEWLESAEGKSATKRVSAKEAILTEAQKIKFLIDHNSSPMTPLIIERTLLPKLSEGYAEQITKTISTSLEKHPYYLSLRNKMLSDKIKAGNEVPDVTLHLLTGETKRLSDYRGKYIVLNFWKNNCEESATMLAKMKELHAVIKDKKDNFIIISLALESDISACKSVIEKNGISVDGWIHAGDAVGAASKAAKLFHVENTPKTILIEPEGHAVSLNMENDEIIMRIKQIMSGDLYYLDQEE